MCTHQKYVHNKYIHKSILVSCGKCESCQQQKSNARALRIRNHNDGRLCLFVTLTYDNRFVPYIYSKDLVNLSDDNIHDVSVRRDYYTRSYCGNVIVREKPVVLASYRSSEFSSFCFGLPELNKKSDCVGVIYWPDAQNFIKRLRTNLKRILHYENKITYYCVGEYGSESKRPHFHLLIYFEKGTIEELRPVIAKSWPYGDMLRQNKRIQQAIDASSYVASYVNKSVGLPKILTSAPIRQKHSHSLYFGANLSAFSLRSLLEKTDNQNLSYSKEILKDGVPMLVTLPIPKDVINRYFPRFKGYSSFSPSEIRDILRCPKELWNRLGRLRTESPLIGLELSYTFEDYRKFVVHLRHCIDCYIRLTGKTIYDYSIDYERVWLARWNFIFKHSYDDVDSFLNFYENINEFVDKLDCIPTLPHPSSCHYQLDPNKRFDVVKASDNLTSLFNEKENIRKIVNIALSSVDDEF